MKFRIYIFCFFLSFALCAQKNSLSLVEKHIIHKDFSALEKLIKTGQNASQVVDEIKDYRDSLSELAASSEVLNKTKEKLGEKKYTKWKRIAFGSSLIGYAGFKLIIESIYGSDELNNKENEGFFGYNRITELGIGATGAYWIYYGITGKDPELKLNNAIKIVTLLKEQLSREEV